MHTLNRLLTLCLVSMLAIPMAMTALVLSSERVATREQLDEAIETAAASYRQRGGAQSAKAKAEESMRQLSADLARLQKEKRALRLELGAMLDRMRAIETAYGVSLSDSAAIELLVGERKSELVDLVQAEYRWDRRHDENEATLLTRGSNGRAVAESEILGMRMAAQDAIKAFSDASIDRETFDERFGALELLRSRYWEAVRAYDNAVELKARSEIQLEQIKYITADVHEQVLKLQGELARIDARLKAKAERALIEKGLMDPEQARDRAAKAAVRFQWPVYGPISAGFRDADYVTHFGVPHHGMDIVVPQGTPVGAAADGVVFLVRDGGLTGYTYVLIGHRDGHATLYGHLSETSVATGQEIEAGQTIGLSGGRPGTRGAGPMTTGSHLHFEVIKNGVNVNPMGVLP
jgi:murein DD-endopeptidase MepM/ murein hydrolase activator NlpD